MREIVRYIKRVDFDDNYLMQYSNIRSKKYLGLYIIAYKKNNNRYTFLGDATIKYIAYKDIAKCTCLEHISSLILHNIILKYKSDVNNIIITLHDNNIYDRIFNRGTIYGRM